MATADPAANDVLAAIRSQGQAAVVIALIPPAGGSDAPATRAAIAKMQEEVLAVLDSTDFRPGVRYTSVAALAGVLLSERGWQRVRDHPLVSGVTLDRGGSGHR